MDVFYLDGKRGGQNECVEKDQRKRKCAVERENEVIALAGLDYG